MMAEWRLFSGWTSEELRQRMERVSAAEVNFTGVEEELTGPGGWHHYHSDAVIAREKPGEDAHFERARVALANYQFSDPGIVVAHFDPKGPLLGRRILLEIKVWGLRYLCPALVTNVRHEPGVYGFRYDTLEGHIERGMEWFVLKKDPDGTIRFRIEARWQRGEMPNWWSRVGFAVLSGYYQRKWHRRAHNLLSLLAEYGSTRRPPRDASGLTHQGVTVTFTYHTKRKWMP
jgi:uncharacterized protein (UPF0548 family)